MPNVCNWGTTGAHPQDSLYLESSLSYNDRTKRDSVLFGPPFRASLTLKKVGRRCYFITRLAESLTRNDRSHAKQA